MILLKLFWITSWISTFLLVNQKLPASLTTNVLPTKVSDNLGKIVNKHRPWFVLPQQPINVWSATLLPTRFLNIDWDNNESNKKLTEPLATEKAAVKNSKKQLCSLGRETVAKQPNFQASSVLASGNIITANPTQQDFFPQKILRSLQDFFRFANPVDQNFISATLPVLVVQRGQDNYEVWVNNRLVASLPTETAAKSMQQRLMPLVKSPNLDPHQLRPALVDGLPALMLGNRFLWAIETQISQRFHRSADLLAIEWINNLRSAFKAPKLTLVEGQKQMYGVTPSTTKISGLASWYGGYFHGRLTANGEIYNKNELTVAHKSLPFNTYLQVTNVKTGKAVIVRVNDRGPYIPPRSLDLSQAAARCLNSEIAGVVPYEAVILRSTQPKMTLKASNLKTVKPRPGKKLALVADF